MARKTIKVAKKVKPNTSRPAVKEIVHVHWLKAYHEVLKHEEVLDIELDVIYGAFSDVIKDNIIKSKMSEEPDNTDIEILVSKVMHQLCGH